MHGSDSQVSLGELLELRQQLIHNCDPIVLSPDRVNRLRQRRVRSAADDVHAVFIFLVVAETGRLWFANSANKKSA
jgi:hypothetical protein